MKKSLESVAYAVAEFNRLMSNLDQYKDGFTINSDFTETPTEGICVAVAATQGNFGPIGALKSFAFAVEHGLHYGGWLDPQTQKFYFDAVRVFPETDLVAALKFGDNNGQLSVFRLSDFTTFNRGSNYPYSNRAIIVGIKDGKGVTELEARSQRNKYQLSNGEWLTFDQLLYWRETGVPETGPLPPPDSNRLVNVWFKPVGTVLKAVATYEDGVYTFESDGNKVKADQILHWREFHIHNI